MEYDCRPKASDNDVQWECKLIMPDGETVALQFRNFAIIPSKISLNNIGDTEGQLWDALRWGLISPEHWPVDSQGDKVRVFEELPTATVLQIHNDWQSKAGVTRGESSASKTSSTPMAKS